MAGGRQYCKIRWRVAKLITHELLHTICFQHEHSRSDRDEYLDTSWIGCNIEKLNNPNEPFSLLGLFYDYVSAMHYPCDSCLKPKMTGVGDNCWNDDNGALSVLDAEKINKFYGCSQYGACYAYHFRKMSDPFQPWDNPVPGGNDPTTGKAFYICRAYHNGDIIPGRATGDMGGCYVGYNGVEYFKTAAKSEVMINYYNQAPLKWKPLAVYSYTEQGYRDFKAIPGGRSATRQPLFLGKCNQTISGVQVGLVGKIETKGWMWAPYGGKEYYCNIYEVLTCG